MVAGFNFRLHWLPNIKEIDTGRKFFVDLDLQLLLIPVV